MSLALEYPVQTEQLKIVAQEYNLSQMKVFIPEDEDIRFEEDTMVIFSDTRIATFKDLLAFSQKVGNLFKRKVYVSSEDELDSIEYLSALVAAEKV
jgi:hypothetical protein